MAPSRPAPEEREKDREVLKSKLKSVLAQHIGRTRRIGMGELYRQVYDKTYNHRINHTRPVRRLITELRAEGMPICSDSGGYWLAAADSEREAYCQRLRSKALRILKQEATIRKTSLAAIAGQLALDLKTKDGRSV